jgi:hypothetical protein
MTTTISKRVLDFRHPVIASLGAARACAQDLTGQTALPALDFLRSDLLQNTGKWRDSDVMDGRRRADSHAQTVIVEDASE